MTAKSTEVFQSFLRWVDDNLYKMGNNKDYLYTLLRIRDEITTNIDDFILDYYPEDDE